MSLVHSPRPGGGTSGHLTSSGGKDHRQLIERVTARAGYRWSRTPFRHKKGITKGISDPRNDARPRERPCCKSFFVNHLHKIGLTGFEPATS